jgi:serine/threonine protein kinase
MPARNYYEILEVSPRARREVIHAAWRELSKVLGDGNPDRSLINEAKEVLEDDVKRAAFDKSISPPKGKVVRIGNYRVIDQIAEGGFGVTYRAEHELLKKLVCIKHSSNISAIDKALMIEEAQAVFDLRHWAIPAVRDIIELEDGSLAIVMSYVPGRNLQQIVDDKGPLDAEHVCWITERVLNALCYLHDNGVIHGDVKPANIIIQPENHQIALVDYGLALVKPGRTTAVKGYTPMFASPEQKENKPLLPESDLYSLGLTMIYALGGDPASMKVLTTTADPVRKFIGRLTVRNVLARPNWAKENLLQTISDVRQEAFGRRWSNMKTLEV